MFLLEFMCKPAYMALDWRIGARREEEHLGWNLIFLVFLQHTAVSLQPH